MSDERFAYGDRVRLAGRPEWGVGSVVKAEDLAVNGSITQSLSVRFAGVGVKRLNTAHADLCREAHVEPEEHAVEHVNAVEVWGKMAESDWLAPLAQRKIEEAMISLPSQATDPFRTVRDRIEFALGLYRFARTGRGLIDWAVAQTGLEDPLTRFSRHELEQYHDRWAFERDAHLGRLVQEAGGGGLPPQRAAGERSAPSPARCCVGSRPCVETARRVALPQHPEQPASCCRGPGPRKEAVASSATPFGVAAGVWHAVVARWLFLSPVIPAPRRAYMEKTGDG